MQFDQGKEHTHSNDLIIQHLQFSCLQDEIALTCTNQTATKLHETVGTMFN